MDTEELNAIFLVACSDLPVPESELPQYAAKLRQMVCAKLLEEYATNLAGSIDELLAGEDEEAPAADSTVAPEDVADPAPVTEGESPPPNPV